MFITILFRQFEKPFSVVLYGIVLSVFLTSCSLHQTAQPNLNAFSKAVNTSELSSHDGSLPPAVRGLIVSADEYIDQKNWQRAITVLERALRINKRQASVWTRMALVYHAKGEYDQAIHMAKRSNSYAAQNNALKSYNWQLISHAYLKLENGQMSRQSAKKSMKYQGSY